MGQALLSHYFDLNYVYVFVQLIMNRLFKTLNLAIILVFDESNQKKHLRVTNIFYSLEMSRIKTNVKLIIVFI